MPTAPGQVAVAPLALYHRADLLRRSGDLAGARRAHEAAQAADLTYCLASRLDDVDMLVRTTQTHPDDARAWALLGHWLYFQRRYDDAVEAWERSVAIHPGDAVVWRNLAVAAFNVSGDAALAAHRYARALELSPGDARLLYELDQLDKRTAQSPGSRLARLEALPGVVAQRDDLTVELVQLLTADGRAEQALALLRGRVFQPWEGGEGQVLSAWDEALLALARQALSDGDSSCAVRFVQEALDPVPSLGEGRHPLANCSHLLLILGDARAAAGDQVGARHAWRQAATFAGDFQATSTAEYSERTYYSVLACRRLGDDEAAAALLAGLARFVDELQSTRATVDYFAASLPTMLLFADDLQAARRTTALLLEAQVRALRGHRAEADTLAAEVLERDPGQTRALDLRRALAADHTRVVVP